MITAALFQVGDDFAKHRGQALSVFDVKNCGITGTSWHFQVPSSFSCGLVFLWDSIIGNRVCLCGLCLGLSPPTGLNCPALIGEEEPSLTAN